MPKTSSSTWKPASEELEDVKRWFESIWEQPKPDYSRSAFEDWRTARDLAGLR